MEKTIELKGKKIFYRVTGEGRPVFLVHGFGEDGEIWKNQYESLRGFQLIIPDLPGSGRSEMVKDMSMEGMAGVLNELAETELGPSETFDMIGHSMGGYVSLAFAEKFPAKLS